MAKLLVECVQCYGKLLLKKRRFYRGVNDEFMFKKFATRYRVPLSTTWDFKIAAQFAGGNQGLIIELTKYLDGGDISYFDCSSASSFDTEKEVLFFGGNTLLRISCIWQVYCSKWTSFRKYIEPLNAIFRMIHGLTVIKQHILSHDKEQRVMLKLLTYILCKQKEESLTQIPPYIEELLTYHISIDTITLNFTELKNEYQWLNSLILRENT
eukprot:523020_1